MLTAVEMGAYHLYDTSALKTIICWGVWRAVFVFPDECKDCHDPEAATVQSKVEAAVAEGILKERPAEEVAARIAQQNQEEQDIIAGRLAGLTLTGRKSIFNGMCGLGLEGK